MDRPIIFSTPMVRALLDGRKTMTRRKAWKKEGERGFVQWGEGPSPWQRVQPGDRLWVREACMSDPDRFTIYRADWERYNVCDTMRWRPSIHMPRWASRITLTVTAVRVERLQQISEADCDAEGFGGDWPHKVAPELFPDTDAAGRLTIPECFGRLWDHLHGPGAWDANPEVVAITFTTRKGNIDDRRHP